MSLTMYRAVKSHASVLLEGAQGSLLDIDHGTYPYVTSSSTTAGGAAIGVGIGPNFVDRVLGVVKAYTTRVGNGPLPTEFGEPLQSEVRRLGNEFGATTGRPRRCGWFDAVVVRYATRVNGLTDLALTKLDVLDVGAGPCGLAAAISAQRAGMKARVLDAGCVVSTITEYPYYVSFFSTAEKLSLGDVPFVVATEKPTRRDALAYYRAIARHFTLDVRQYERVSRLERVGDAWRVYSVTTEGAQDETQARSVGVATGYFGSPNRLGVAGEELPHVRHTYREGHGAFDQDVVVVGGGNSAAEAALDLWRAGARVTLVHFGPTFDKRIKPWVLPDFENRANEGVIATRWSSRVAP